MSSVTTLFALKCKDGYIKIENASLSAVGMSKASVFPLKGNLEKYVGDDPVLGRIWMVKMEITETDV